VWRLCRHPIATGFSGAIFQPLPGPEIESSARAAGVEITTALLERIRRLDDAWLSERNQALNKGKK